MKYAHRFTDLFACPETSVRVCFRGLTFDLLFRKYWIFSPSVRRVPSCPVVVVLCPSARPSRRRRSILCPSVLSCPVVSRRRRRRHLSVRPSCRPSRRHRPSSVRPSSSSVLCPSRRPSNYSAFCKIL